MSKRKGSPINLRSNSRSPEREPWRVARSREREAREQVERERKSQERRSRERRERNSRERRGRSRSRDNNEREELEKVLQEKFVKAYKIKSEQARGRYETAIALERAERSTEVQSLIAKITALEAKLAAQASVPAQVPAKAPPAPAAADMYLQQYVNHNSWIKTGRFDKSEPIYEHPELANTEWLVNYYWDERDAHITG